MPKGSTAADRELKAMGAILTALTDLDGESIQRVLDYVFSRLSIAAPSHIKTIASLPSPQSAQSIDLPQRSRRPSVRDLKDEKQPESSNQMAALVAYYLSEVAEESEWKEAINTADLEKYFKQAGFRLPRSLSQTLPNATAAGYFDAEGNGLYKLNPVGYNLVVHGLPRGHKANDKPRKRPKPKARTHPRKS
jgi:hypothetical protein